MSGPPHGFPTSFANSQQAAMSRQFVSGPGGQIPGLMPPNQQPGLQTGMVNPQAYGVGMQGGVGVGMQPQNPQQVAQQLLQQQQLQLQQQQLQQQQQQQQQPMQQQSQQQQPPPVGGVASAPVGGVPGAVPPGSIQQPPGAAPTPSAPPKEFFNTVSLCKFGQENVQDIVSRTNEIFQILKSIQPPNGTVPGANVSNEKKVKVAEQLRNVRMLFKRLRIIYEKCNDSCQLQGMEYMHIESLIPLKEEWDMKSDERKMSEQYRVTCDESKEIMEQVIQKNRQLKEIIDHLRRIIFEINTMLTMRRS